MVVIFPLVHLRIDTNPNLMTRSRPTDRFANSTVLPSTLSSTTRALTNFPEPQVVIASIDEKSVEKYGLWPWPRSLTGDFIRTAGEGGAAVIAFDVAFVDEDRNNVRPSVQRLRQKLLDSKLGQMVGSRP